MTLDDLDAALAPDHLTVMGALHEGASIVVLIGPREPDFWPHVTGQPEMQDTAPDPLDRWSKRVIGAQADALGAKAIYPSDGPPYPPFIAWALASGRCFLSPAGLLVHSDAGLMISFRGALRMPALLKLSEPQTSPCASCITKPCTTACPVAALKPDGYDVPACQAHIRGPDSMNCRAQGCAARRACPVSQTYGRQTAQSAFHMRAFLGE